MNYYRGNAIAVGVLLIACTASSILSAIPLGSTLESPDYLSNLAVNSNRVIVTALMEFVWAATGAGIAIGMYPILRKYNAALALGSATGRIVEGVFVLIGTLSLLVLLSVSERSLMAGSAAPYQATGDALLAVREWVHGFLIFLPFLVGALTYYYMLYRSRLVPRWLSAWGLVGAALSLVATVYCGFAQDFGFTTLNTVQNIPIALQEMVFVVWLIVKGFNLSTAPSLPSIETPAHEAELHCALPTQA